MAGGGEFRSEKSGWKNVRKGRKNRRNMVFRQGSAVFERENLNNKKFASEKYGMDHQTFLRDFSKQNCRCLPHINNWCPNSGKRHVSARCFFALTNDPHNSIS